MLGYAYQLGHVPIGAEAIEQAIELNGAAVEMSRNAFRFGRLAAHDKAAIERMIGAATTGAAEDADAGGHRRLPRRAAHRSTRMRRWPSAIARASRTWPRSSASRRPAAPGSPRPSARGYYKLLAYKDEYEVARLYASPAFEKALGEQFEARAQARVPSGAAAAGAARQGHRRAAQDALRRLDAARVPPAGQGQAPARHGLRRVRLLGRAQARAADDRRLREADRRDRRSGFTPRPTRTAWRSPRSPSTSRASATSRSATTRPPRRARRHCSTSCAIPRRPRSRRLSRAGVPYRAPADRRPTLRPQLADRRGSSMLLALNRNPQG